MAEQGRGGLELAWFLGSCVALLFLIFGVVELVGPQPTVSFWLVAGLLGSACSIVVVAVSRSCTGATDTFGGVGGSEPGNGHETSFLASDKTRGVIVDAALASVETQLLAQVADDASLDGRATGLIGFNGALSPRASPSRNW
jgi:hypothetical protein